MKQNIQICVLSLVNPSDSSIRGQTYNNKLHKDVFFTTGYEIRIGEMLPNESMWRQNLTKKEPTYRFEWDKNNKNHYGSKLREFLMGHMLVNTPGFSNENLTMHLFDLYDEVTVNQDKYSRIDEIHTCINIWKDMSWEEQCNAAFIFGGNPYKLTKRELFLFMFNEDNGALREYTVSGSDVNNAALSFIKKFKTKELREQNEIEATIQKAISFSLIKETPTENGVVYSVAGEVIGNDLPTLVGYYTGRRDKFYTTIQSPLSAKLAWEEPSDDDDRPTQKDDVAPKRQGSMPKAGSGSDVSGSKAGETTDAQATKAIQNLEQKYRAVKGIMESKKPMEERVANASKLMPIIEGLEKDLDDKNINYSEVKSKYAEFLEPLKETAK